MDGDFGIRVARHEVLAAGGRQGSRKRVGQLVEDGLTPDEHIEQALRVEHPFLRGDCPSKAISWASSEPRPAPQDLIVFREEVCQVPTESAREGD